MRVFTISPVFEANLELTHMDNTFARSPWPSERRVFMPRRLDAGALRNAERCGGLARREDD
jgi:hypothetical protein